MKHINKAIEKDPENLDYRWMRVRSLIPTSNMMHGIDIETANLALRDLEYLIENGKESGKLYMLMGSIYNELALEYKSKSIGINLTPNDSIDEQNAKKKRNLEKALELYNESILSYQKATAIENRYTEKINFELLSVAMDEIQKQISQL